MRVVWLFPVIVAISVFTFPIDAHATEQHDVDSLAFPVFLTKSLRHGLDTSISPCTDFDQFANGGWRAKTELPDTMNALTVFHATYLDTQRQIRILLDSGRRVANTTKDAELRVLGWYYESCLRADSIPRFLNGVSMYRSLQSDTSRASRCVRLAMYQLPTLLGQLFSRSLMSPRADSLAKTMIAEIRNEIELAIQRFTFVPSDAKARTIETLRYMKFKIAKPSDTLDFSRLQLTSSDFSANQRSIQEYTLGAQLPGQSQGGSKWKGSQYNPNAHYSPADNSIEIPAFLFQWPFFDPSVEPALSYAAGGTVLGHEILHGVAYKLGSEGEEATVHKHVQRLVQIYSRIDAGNGTFVNGQQTLNENIADLGGLLVAYEAWRKHGRESAVPTIEGFTPDQRFFLYYARLWRAKVTDKYLQLILSKDLHAPPRARINGVVMNIPAFAKAFGCKEGDPMALPADQRVTFW